MSAVQIKRSAVKASLLMAVMLLMTACLFDKLKKNKDPEPELAGTYQVSRLTSGRQTFNLPSNGVSAAVIVNRRGDSQIDVRITTNDNGSTDSNDFPTLDIKKASGRDYDILTSNTRIGSVNGTNFTLDFTTNGDRFLIIAEK